MDYIYNTEFGTFKISKNSYDGRCSLHINDECLGSYQTPQQAADDVFMCATGFDDWDDQICVDNPIDLTEWTKQR